MAIQRSAEIKPPLHEVHSAPTPGGSVRRLWRPPVRHLVRWGGGLWAVGRRSASFLC